MQRVQFLRASSLLRAHSSRPTTAISLGLRNSSHDHHHASPSSDVFPDEGFNAPFWRNGVVLALAVALAWRLAPSSTPLSADSNPEDNESPITSYIAYHMPAAGLWQERAAKHLELAKAAAEDKLLFQEAERPKVRRLRYLGTFDQASPNNIEVGSQADLSHLVIKSEKGDFSYGKTEGEAEEEE